MSGHSKWSTIKRKKGANDAKRGAIFTKIIKEITVAAKNGGEDQTSNPSLRAAVLKAKANNMPNDNIERAIKKGAGTLEGVSYEEIRYEGYGPGGVAIMVNCLTDNKNRTTPLIRMIFSKNGGNLGETGSVNYLFDRKAMFIIESGQTNEDEIMELLIDFDLEDIKTEEDNIIITANPDHFHQIAEVLDKKNYNLLVNEVTFVPQTTISLDEKKATQCLRIVELLEEEEDVQDVYSNFDISDELMLKISEGQ